MAAITVTYWGLTSTKGTVAVDDTDSIDDLIAAVATDEGLPTNYYQLSKSTDPSNTLSSIVGDSTSQPTLNDLGIGDGDTVFCTTNQVGSKEERQIQKLDIAAVKRSDTYDITQLPTQYSGNNVIDNPNVGGLVLGRPWTTGAVTALFTSLGAEFEIRVDDTTGISPGMVMTGMDYGSATVTVVTVISSTSLEMSIIAPDTVPAPGTVLTFTNP